VAQLLSPRLAALLSLDPTMLFLEIEVGEENDFGFFTSLLRTGEAEACDQPIASNIRIARQLGNTELVAQLAALRPLPSELTTSNILEELRFFELLEESPPVEYLRFAAANFYRLTDVLCRELKPQTVDLILSESVVLKSEDALFDFLKGEIGEHWFDLLRHVQLSCLSEAKYEEFMALLDPSTLTPGIWARIRSIRRDPRARSGTHSYELCVPYGGQPFDGIFAHLNRVAGGNCAERGLVWAVESNKRGGELSVLFADSDWSGNNYWCHNNVRNGWFKVDFRDRRVSVKHYAIHNSATHGNEYHFLKTWTLEGCDLDAMADSEWTVIDSRRNDENLHRLNAQAVFECNGDTSHAFRYIRLVQRGASHDNSSYSFLISQFEIFGAVSPPD
jgi:hypothetical protein